MKRPQLWRIAAPAEEEMAELKCDGTGITGIGSESKQAYQYLSVCFFLPTGKTFTFRNVTILQDNQTEVVFEYCAMSDGLMKEGTFYKSQIVGVAKLKR